MFNTSTVVLFRQPRLLWSRFIKGQFIDGRTDAQDMPDHLGIGFMSVIDLVDFGRVTVGCRGRVSHCLPKVEFTSTVRPALAVTYPVKRPYRLPS